MRCIFTIICVCLLQCTISVTEAAAQAQKLAWARNINTGYEGAYAVTTDAEGNSYMTGTFTGKVDFDPGPGTYELDAPTGMFITKMNAAGQLLWVKSFDGDGAVPQDIQTDALGNIYITGFYFGYADGVDFDPGPGEHKLYSDFQDIFVSKLDASGDFAWAVRLGSDDGIVVFNQGYALNVEEQGAVYLTGAVAGENDFDPGPGTSMIITPAYDPNVFICKLRAADGSLNWVRTVAGESISVGAGIVLDHDKHLYVAGTFSGTQDFNPAGGGFDMTANGGSAAFVLRLDTGGAFSWVRQLGGATASASNYSEGWAIAAGTDRVFITGRFTGTADFDPGAGQLPLTSSADRYDAYMVCLDTSGNLAWAGQFGGTGENAGIAIDRDAAGNLYMFGHFTGTTDFDPDPAATFNLTEVYGNDVVITKLDASGKHLWSGHLGHGDPSSAPGNSSYISMDGHVDRSGNIYAAGKFFVESDFDPGPDVATLSLPGTFLVKLICADTVSSEVSVTTCGSYELNGAVYTESGTYIQQFARASGCDSTVILNLVVGPINTAVSSGAGQLKVEASGAAYQWIRCEDNTPVEGAVGQSFEPAEDGAYAVVVTLGSCRDTSACTGFAAGVAAYSYGGQTLTAYPNPASGRLHIGSLVALDHAGIKIFSSTGLLVREWAGLTGTLTQLDVSGLSSGVYYLEVTDRGQIRRISIAVTE